MVDFESRAAELRTEMLARRAAGHSLCRVCDRRVLKPGEALCCRCRQAPASDPARVAAVSLALRVRLCISCLNPFEAHPRLDAPKLYCSRSCAAKGASLVTWHPRDWDACRMLADMDYTGPYPFPESCWSLLAKAAWDAGVAGSRIGY